MDSSAIPCIRMRSFTGQIQKHASTAATGSALGKFWQGAKHEVGPALGAVTGAGLAKATGFDPLAGAAAGYGLGAAPDIVHAIKEKRLAAMLAKKPDIAGGI